LKVTDPGTILSIHEECVLDCYYRSKFMPDKCRMDVWQANSKKVKTS
jgi:hypothetical protein